MPAPRFWAVSTAFALAFGVATARADTTQVKAWEVVRVEKTGRHCADDKNCFNRMHPAIPAVRRRNPASTSFSAPAMR